MPTKALTKMPTKALTKMPTKALTKMPTKIQEKEIDQLDKELYDIKMRIYQDTQVSEINLTRLDIPHKIASIQRDIQKIASIQRDIQKIASIQRDIQKINHFINISDAIPKNTLNVFIRKVQSLLTQFK